MRIRVTVFYGDEEESLTQETAEYTLLSMEDDPDSFDEALDTLRESLIEPYEDEGHELEDDDDSSVGTDYLACWTVYDAFETKKEAQDFLKTIISDAEDVLSDLE